MSTLMEEILEVSMVQKRNNTLLMRLEGMTGEDPALLSRVWRKVSMCIGELFFASFPVISKTKAPFST